MKSQHAGRFGSVALLTLVWLTWPALAQQSGMPTRGPIVIREFKHDTGPLLREVAPLLPELSPPSEHEIENNVNPNHNWKAISGPDAVLQRPETSPTVASPSTSLEFDGLGFSDANFCDCMPPDNDGAPGTTQYVQYINTFYAVYSKTGSLVLGPLSGNAFWSGFGGSCQNDNSGDPIVRFDAAAQRWVVSQFAINGSGSDYECIAVSQTADATGAYNRYAFQFNVFPDYPKMGVWPDAYYFTFNNFNLTLTSFIGADACAVDRTKMLAGQAATMICFQQNSSQWSLLPSDLDGPTPPAAGTPNFFAELDPSGNPNIDLFQFHVDFTTPSNSTFAGPTLIPVASFTPLCATQFRGRCVTQPGSGTDLLESLGDRLMYRLVYRNFGDHTTLLASHSVQAGSSGGVRWYEIRNPESSPAVYQSGTFAPDSQFRWVPAIAMDQYQDLAVGYSRSGSAAGQYPSVAYAGRVPSDPAGTLEAEFVMKAGAGSQKSSYDRWGDYSSLTVDPADDCTFWFTEEYQQSTGGFNWSTAIGTFSFPACGGSGTPVVSLSATKITFVKTPIGQTSAPKSVTLTNTGTGTLNLASVTVSGDYMIQSNSCGSQVLAGAGCTVTLAFTPTAKGTRKGTLSFADNASGGLQTVALTGTGQSIALSPNPVSYGTVVAGQNSTTPVTVTNLGVASVNLTGFTITGANASNFTITANTCGATLAAGANCSISLTFTPNRKGKRSGQLNVVNNGSGSPSSAKLAGVGG